MRFLSDKSKWRDVVPHVYVHGYTTRESERLSDQAMTLRELLHHDTSYREGEFILEVGCGTGAQTITLAAKSPGSHFVSVDISLDSIQEAEKRIRAAGFSNVTFINSDIFGLPFSENSFDHVFVCFVLEHLADPEGTLNHLKRLLKKGGTITVIEGDHGSAYFYPECPESSLLIELLSKIQNQSGGNALIGRQLYPLLLQSGFRDIQVSPRMVYADGSRPDLQKGFTLDTFTAMIEGIQESVLQSHRIDKATWVRGIEGLRRSAYPDGVFCYTFFKAVAYA